MKIITMNSYRRLALARNTRLMLIIDTSLLFCFGNLNSRDCHGDSLNVMFRQFSYCFLPFPLVFSHVSPGVSTVSVGVSPVSYYRFRVRNVPISKEFQILTEPGKNLLG